MNMALVPITGITESADEIVDVAGEEVVEIVDVAGEEVVEIVDVAGEEVVEIVDDLLVGDPEVAVPVDEGTSVVVGANLDPEEGVVDVTADAELEVIEPIVVDEVIETPLGDVDINLNVPCFCTGTQIATKRGLVAVERLMVGDMVLTLDNGYCPIRWINGRALSKRDLALNPKLLPVRITAGALGNGTPVSDLMVSRQHRVLVTSAIVERMFDTNEVLIPAIKLCGLDGVEQVTDATEVGYWHILFDRHEVVFSNGLATESLFTGPEALKSLPFESREEIIALFPEISNLYYAPIPARQICEKGSVVKQLISRHEKNGHVLESIHPE
jgi:hypothetical protein